MQPFHPHPARLFLRCAVASTFLAQLLKVHCDAVQEVASVHDHTIVPLQTDLGLKLGVWGDEVELCVDSDAMLEAGESHTGVPSCCNIVCVVTVGDLQDENKSFELTPCFTE